MKHSVKKRILTLVMAVVVALGVFPAGTVFAAADAEAVRGLSVVPGKTTQQNIDTAWGEGTAEFTESEGVYTLKLLKNLEMEGELVLGTRLAGEKDPKIILDLNGCTVTSMSIALIVYGNVEIRDSSEDMSGSLVFPGDPSGKKYVGPINNSGGYLVIEGGNFRCEGKTLSSYSCAVSSTADSTTIINGGNLECEGASALITYGDVILNGGTLTGKYGMMAKVSGGSDVGGHIEIPEDSEVEVQSAQFAFVVQSNDGQTIGSISAAGGSYHSDQYVLGSIGKVPSPAEQLELTGGQFNIDPTAYADDVPVAEVVSKGGDSKGFFIGKKTEEAASQVESGDQIVVKKGDAVLEGLPKDVIVKNEGDGSVTANGNTVLLGTSVQIQDSAAEEPSLPAISSINGWKLRRNTDWYYYKNGKTVTGWIELEGIRYYLDETGKMATGWKLLDGKWYYFYKWGGMAKGWVLVDDIWYYMNADGTMATGWIQLDGKWYYLYRWGGMAKGWASVNDVWYYLNENGDMATGWKEIGGKWYHLRSWGGMSHDTVVGGYRVGSDGTWIR